MHISDKWWSLFSTKAAQVQKYDIQSIQYKLENKHVRNGIEIFLNEENES